MNLDRHYQFGPFQLDAGGRLLSRDRQRLTLSLKAVELLIEPVESQAITVTKEELLNRV